MGTIRRSELVRRTLLVSFSSLTKYGLKIESYRALYDWSVEGISEFWGAMWEFADIKASRRYERGC